MSDRLGLPAAEHVAVKLGTGKDLPCRLADCLEPPQSQRERARHLFGALAFGCIGIGQ